MLLSLASYLAGGRRIERFAGNPALPALVLVHGLLHRGIMLRKLGLWLNSRGYTVYLYDYKTTRRTVEEHGGELAEFLHSLPESRLGLVTHSMGGLLARVALCRLSGTPDAGRIFRVVMLAPPHHGSELAARWLERFAPSPFLVRSLPDLSCRAGAACHSLPVPEGFEIGVIAGDHDTKVTVESTHLEGENDHIVISSGHSFIMNKPVVREQLLAFLENGRFHR